MALDEIESNGQAFADDPVNRVCNVSTAPVWEWLPGSASYCASLNGNLPPHLFVLETDINPNSSTYLQTRWSDVGPREECPSGNYYNAAQSQNFTRNNCPSGYTGSTVTYTVPAGTYSSTTSQAAADQLAMNDINANGQNYANTNGTCTQTIYCSFTSGSGFSVVAGSPSHNGSYVSFYIVFYSIGGSAYWYNTNTVANVSPSCRPSVNRTFNMSESGRTWEVTVTTSGDFMVRLISGTPPSGTQTIGLTNGSYNL
jgi:hypothetical protein